MKKALEKVSLEKLSYLPLFWYSFFLLIPLLLVLIMSFATKGAYGGIEWTFGFGNFTRAFDFLYLNIFFKSLTLAFFTASFCVLFGLPLALTMATASEKHRPFYLILIAIPFLTNLVIRIYALKTFVGYDGPLMWIFRTLQLEVDPFAISQNQTLVFFGMVSTYLPFFVFPIYGALEKFDFALVEASFDLGATPLGALFSVIIPNIKTAIISAFMLVFIPALGEFVIPDLLGGAKSMLIGNLITEQFLKARDWPFGGALSILLILLLTFAFALSKLFEGKKGRTL